MQKTGHLIKEKLIKKIAKNVNKWINQSYYLYLKNIVKLCMEKDKNKVLCVRNSDVHHPWCLEGESE